MKKTFIAGVAALSVTLGAVAPAQANGINDDQIGKLLFGIVAVATVVQAIKNTNRARHQTQPVEQPTPKVAPHDPLFDWGYDSAMDRFDVLPGRCLSSVVDLWGQPLRIVGRNCMRRHYDHVAELPRECRMRIRTENGQRRGWNPHCLRNEGYTIARHY